jgi:hypothetical protein
MTHQENSHRLQVAWSPWLGGHFACDSNRIARLHINASQHLSVFLIYLILHHPSCPPDNSTELCK